MLASPVPSKVASRRLRCASVSACGSCVYCSHTDNNHARACVAEPPKANMRPAACKATSGWARSSGSSCAHMRNNCAGSHAEAISSLPNLAISTRLASGENALWRTSARPVSSANSALPNWCAACKRSRNVCMRRAVPLGRSFSCCKACWGEWSSSNQRAVRKRKPSRVSSAASPRTASAASCAACMDLSRSGMSCKAWLPCAMRKCASARSCMR